jgi:hypothetical protein
MAGKNKESSSITTAAIFGTYIIFANDTDFVREFVKAKPFDPAAMATRTLEKRMAALETPQTGGRQVIHLEQSWERPFEELKAGNPAVDDYSSVRLLKLILTGDTSNKFAKQYSLLPKFAEAKKFLAPHGGVSDADPNGVLSRGFVLKAATAK